jgi:hypothetical protein
MRVRGQLRPQPGRHRRPFAVEDREAPGVAPAAVAVPQVLAQDAFLARAEPRDRGARREVQRAGVEADAGAAQRFERVREQQELRLGIQAGALHGARIPRVTDAQPRRVRQQFVVAGAADDPAVGRAHGEGELLAGGLLRQRGVEPRPDIARHRHVGEREFPEAAVARGRAQGVGVFRTQGFELDVAAAQRGDDGHACSGAGSASSSVGMRLRQWATQAAMPPCSPMPYQNTFQRGSLMQPSHSAK